VKKEEVLVDTNICLDLLAKRGEHYLPAARLFTLADREAVKICVSSLSFHTLDYLLSRQYSAPESRQLLRKFKLLVQVLAVDEKIISLSLESDFKDFEDAIQYFTATEHNVPLLLTRNLKDFKLAAIPVMTAESFLSQLD
jgi:predicted nucleic acid-binding protein